MCQEREVRAREEGRLVWPNFTNTSPAVDAESVDRPSIFSYETAEGQWQLAVVKKTKNVTTGGETGDVGGVKRRTTTDARRRPARLLVDNVGQDPNQFGVPSKLKGGVVRITTSSSCITFIDFNLNVYDRTELPVSASFLLYGTRIPIFCFVCPFDEKLPTGCWMRCLEKKNLVQRENCVLNLITKNRRFSLSIFRCAVPSHAAVSKCVKRSDKSYCSTRELNVSLADNKASVIAAPEIPCQCRRRYSLSLPLRYSRKQPPTIF